MMPQRIVDPREICRVELDRRPQVERAAKNGHRDKQRHGQPMSTECAPSLALIVGLRSRDRQMTTAVGMIDSVDLRAAFSLPIGRKLYC